MQRLTAREICAALNGKLLSGSGEESFDTITTDSRRIIPGALFLALRGDKFDGHEFIKAAQDSGANGAIIDRPDSAFEKRGAVILVSDTMRAYGDLANHYRRKFPFPIIGLTGTSGKTTTKDMLSLILSKKGKTLATEANYNNLVGVPLTLFRLEGDEKFAVIEMGTNHFGEIARLTEIVDPDVALITNVGPGHLEFFINVDGVLKAKTELIQGLRPGTTFILNMNDARLANFPMPANIKVIRFGFDVPADIHAEKLEFPAKGGTRFTVAPNIQVYLPVTGEHMAKNALAAMTVASVLGISLAESAVSLREFSPGKMRCQQKDIAGIHLIDDSYNANPDSTFAALQTLSLKSGRKIAVLGDMLELGELSESLHFGIGEQVVKLGIDRLACFGDLAKQILAGALRSGMNAQDARHFSSREEAAKFAVDKLQPGDTVLIKGSRGIKMEQIAEIICQTLETKNGKTPHEKNERGA